MSSQIFAGSILKFPGKSYQIPDSRCIFKSSNPQISKSSHFKIFKFLLCASASLCSVFTSNAQLLTPLSNEMNRRVEYKMIQTETPIFTIIKPYLENKDYTQFPDSLPHLQILKSSNFQIDSSSNLQIKKSWFHRKLFHESFIQVDSGNFYLFADPVFEFGMGKDSKGKNTMVNTRGLRAGVRLGKYFAIGTEFYENQTVFNSVLHEQIKKTKVVPGQGQIHTEANVRDYAFATGYISFSPHKKLNLQFGQGKHFIGDGYRSLILSDASYAYPYARATWTSKKWMYSWLLNATKNIGLAIQNRNNKEPFKGETLSTHLFSYNINHKLQVSLIQSQIFNNPDTMGHYSFDARLYNPLFLPVSDSKNIHSLWGLNVKWNVYKGIFLYSQGVVDNLISKNTLLTAIQLGFKYFDVAGIPGLYMQGEYNKVDPFMYTSPEKPLQWMHYAEPLAHPAGHNVEEVVCITSYNWWRLQIYNQTNVSRNLEPLDAYAPIITPSLPYYTSTQKLVWNKTELVFYINPKTLMNFALGYVYRKETLAGTSNTLTHFYFSFRTSLINRYYDR